MNTNRRQMLKGLSLGAGSMLLSPMIQRVMANAEGKERPPRFVFVLQSNGFDAVQACPESIPFSFIVTNGSLHWRGMCLKACRLYRPCM